MSKTCSSCKWWTNPARNVHEDYLGECDSPKVNLDNLCTVGRDEVLCAIRDGHWCVVFITGENFGCVHYCHGADSQ